MKIFKKSLKPTVSLDNKLLLTDHTKAQVALPPMVRPASGFFLLPSLWDIWGIVYISVASFGYIEIYRTVNINNGWLSKSLEISYGFGKNVLLGTHKHSFKQDIRAIQYTSEVDFMIRSILFRS